ETATIAEIERGLSTAGRRRGLGKVLVLTGSLVVTLVVTLLTLQIGAGGVTAPAVVDALVARATGSVPADAQELRLFTTVWELRTPRAGLALRGGAALAIAGVLFQGLLRTPLVSPFPLGIAPAAAFGAALALLFVQG